MTPTQLALAASVAYADVMAFERGRDMISEEKISAMRAALEAAGAIIDHGSQKSRSSGC